MCTIHTYGIAANYRLKKLKRYLSIVDVWSLKPSIHTDRSALYSKPLAGEVVWAVVAAPASLLLLLHASE